MTATAANTDHLRSQLKRLGGQAGQRIFCSIGGQIVSADGLKIVGRLGDGTIFVQIKNYAMQPDETLGAITGMDSSEIKRLQDAAFEHDAVMVIFLDCVLGIAYWATLGQLLHRAGQFEDINGRMVTVPYTRVKHGQPGADYVEQWLWPLLWFKSKEQWAELTPLETAAMRRCRTPRSATGIARLGLEDAERQQFNSFEQAWLARRSQKSLF